jgi:hypothetical protein
MTSHITNADLAFAAAEGLAHSDEFSSSLFG